MGCGRGGSGGAAGCPVLHLAGLPAGESQNPAAGLLAARALLAGGCAAGPGSIAPRRQGEGALEKL